MKTQDAKKSTRRDAIAHVFESMGGPAPIVEIAKRCMEAGVWTREDDDRALFRARCAEVREILNDAAADGLPRAIQKRVSIDRAQDGSVEKVHVWYQREFWTEGLAKQWLRNRREQFAADLTAMRRFADHAKERWPGTDWKGLVPEVSW